MLKEFFPLRGTGQFYKGNLHCHSTISDGMLSPSEIVTNYKNHGYSFLCFSEHNVFTHMKQFCTSDFITIPAIEWSSDLVIDGKWVKTHHVHGILGSDQMLYGQGDYQGQGVCQLKDGEILSDLEYHGMDTVTEMGQRLIESGNICIYNHPSWSKTSYEDYGDLDGFTAIEMWNYSGEVDNHTGSACVHWDTLLDKGIKIFGVATDDNHNRSTPDDSFGGWICVKAPELSRSAIMDAIVKGEFYSSSGPEIIDFGIENNIVTIRCSPVHHINFVSGPYVCGGHTVWGDENDSLTQAEWTLDADAKYVRVECIDKLGYTAWSNPIFFDEK